MKSSPSAQLEKAQTQLNKVSEHLRHIFTNTTASTVLLDEKRKQMLFRFQIQSLGTPQHPENSGSNIIGEIGSDMMRDFASLKTINDELVTSPLYKLAEKEIQPLLTTIAKLETTISEQRASEAQATRELAEARQAAIDEALANVEASFAVS